MSLDERILLSSTSGAIPGREETVKKFLGRVTHYNLQSKKLHSLSGIELCGGVRYLYAYNNAIRELPTGLQDCKQLAGLYLDHNELQSLEGIELAAKLEVLLVGHNEIQVVSSHLTACTDLRELSLAQQRLPPDTSLYFEPGVLASLGHSLTSLDVSGCGLTSFMQFAVLPKLTRFLATDNHVSEVNDAANLLSRLPMLEEVDVRRNLLTQTAGPGGAYRAVLLASSVSPRLKVLDGKPVAQEHMQFISALTSRRAAPDGGGMIGSSLIPMRATRLPPAATPRGLVTSSTGRMPGSIGQSDFGISPVTGSVRSSPSGYAYGYDDGPGYGSDDLIDTDGTRRSGRFVPLSVMKSAAHGHHGGYGWPSQARGPKSQARGVLDPAAAAAVYGALRSGGPGANPGGLAGQAYGRAIQTPGSHPSSQGQAARALTFQTPSPSGMPGQGRVAARVGLPSQQSAPGEGELRMSTDGSAADLNISGVSGSQDGGVTVEDDELLGADDGERSPEDRVPQARMPHSGGRVGMMSPAGPGARTGLAFTPGATSAPEAGEGDAMNDTLPKYGATPGLSAWKDRMAAPRFLDTHITEEGEGMDETTMTQTNNLGETAGSVGLVYAPGVGSVPEETGTEGGQGLGDSQNLGQTMTSSRGGMGSRGSSRASDGGLIMAGADMLAGVHASGGASIASTMSLPTSAGSMGRPPLAPHGRSGSFHSYGEPEPEPQQPRYIEVPRGDGKPPLLLPLRPASGVKVGSASGFQSRRTHNPREGDEVEPPNRTPTDFTRGSRFKESFYARNDDKKRAAAAVSSFLLSQRGHGRSGAQPVPAHLTGGLGGNRPEPMEHHKGGNTAGKQAGLPPISQGGKTGHGLGLKTAVLPLEPTAGSGEHSPTHGHGGAIPKRSPVHTDWGTVHRDAPEEYLIGGVLSAYVAVKPDPPLLQLHTTRLKGVPKGARAQ